MSLSHNNSKKERSPSLSEEMYVTKRDGKREIVSFDKILNRIKKLGNEGNMKLNYTNLVMKVIDQLYDGISTTKIDELSAEQCASMASIHPDYNVLAGYIIISNHHKNTAASFKKVMTQLHSYKDIAGNPAPLISDETFQVIKKHAVVFDKMCDFKRDYLIDYFGYKTLERAYLMKINKKTVERIQHMWLRVSIGIHGDNLERIQETYDLLSQKYFTHATPTLFNAGTPRPQNSSCFLLGMENDSIEGIYNTLKDCAMISKWAGGIGLHIHNVRASGSHIRGTNGSSNGIVPMLKVFNHTAKYVDQCLDPDTIVYTKRGAIPIKNIVIGDEVITDDGEFYEIGKILDNQYYGDMYSLDIKHTLSPLKLTDMHPLWTIKNNKYIQRNFDNIINMLDRNLIVPEFIEVKNIDKNDFIGFPIPQYEKDIIHYTEDDCRFYGILLGDGNISSTNNLAYVALNKETKSETIKFVEEYLNKLNIHITYTEYGDKYLRLTWTRTSIFKFTYEMCYDNNKEKYIMPSMLHLPKSKILQFIKGILETDGKVKDYQIVLEITSQNTVEGIRYMLLRLGILTSGSIRNRIGEGHVTKNGKYIECKKKSYILIIPKNKIICDLFPEKNLSVSSSFTYFEYDNYLFSIVNNNTFIKDYSGRVIDIEVDNENHHNFLTHNGLVKNGGGKRNGSFAIYLEPWHADIELFLQMRKNHGDEELKARDLFYALWVPDLFMERIKSDGKWTLMCPDECPGLSDVYGDEFVKLYTKYEDEGKGRVTLKARDLWFQILDAQMETGTPYLVYKDAANKKSNQKNVGTIKSSNLCVAPETMILTDKGYYRIDELSNQPSTMVWNGEEYTETKVMKTGENQELMDVYFNDGSHIQCTKYHKFYIKSDYNITSQVEAQNLSIGSTIIDYNYPFIDGVDKYSTDMNKNSDGPIFLSAYTHGVLSSSAGYYDYTITKYRTNGSDSIPMLKIHSSKEDITHNLSYFRNIEHIDYVNNTEETYSVLFLSSNVGDKYYVPINDSLKYKLEWFSGVCDIDGEIINNEFVISTFDNKFAKDLKMMLETCGTDSIVNENNSKYFINISMYNMCLLLDIVIDNDWEIYSKTFTYIIKNSRKMDLSKQEMVKTISNVVYNGRLSDTYCFTEKNRGMGIFNSILTGQCSEIIEYSDGNETAVCFTGDTQILTKDGYRRIDDCDGREVLSYFNNDIEFKESEEFVKATLINNGIKDVYELECYGMKKIKATENHLFAVIEKRNYDKKINTYKWKKFCELDMDDRIVIPKTKVLPMYDNDIFKNVNEDYLTIGWMLGDGWQCKTSNKSVYGVCFGPNEVYARDKVIMKLNEWIDNCDFEKGGHNIKTTEYRTDKRTGVYSWSSSKKQFVQFIKDNFGLTENTAHYKVIPNKIKIATPTEQASFLSGLFSADGNVYISNKNNKERFNINLSSSSKFLLDDVQNMLKQFGIDSRIIYGNVKNRNNEQGKISIENKDSVYNYYKYINFLLCKEKQDTLEYGIKTIKKKEMFTNFGRIKSIDYVGREIVYDLNVPRTHNFIAEGFAVHNCNLSSIALPSYVNTSDPNNIFFDYEKLHSVTKVVTNNLNRIIDVNYYPTEKTKRSNMRHRPIGIGVQGLADVFMLMNIPFTSETARHINHNIFETIYHAALEKSCELAMESGPYETFAGSPASEGILQFDLWDASPTWPGDVPRYDWDAMKQKIKIHGLRNSLLLAPMPTASTSQILGNNECFEPITSNIYNRRTIAGEFILANKYLMKDLIALDMWNDKIKNNIIANNGSIQHIDIIPQEIRDKYKTVWELSMRDIIDMAADRGKFVCQSQSLNLWVEDPTYANLTAMHFHGHKKGLKTGIYYLRRRARAKAQQFSVEPEKMDTINNNKFEEDEHEICESCSA